MCSPRSRVPPAFVVTTALLRRLLPGGRTPDGLFDEIVAGIRCSRPGGPHSWRRHGRCWSRCARARRFDARNDGHHPQPGDHDTTEAALAVETEDTVFAADVRRRFSALYGKLVAGCLEDLEELPTPPRYWPRWPKTPDERMPEDPYEALRAAVGAVFESSQSRRAKAYRAHYGIPDDLGTAVTIQAMVFGNLDDDSGTGVLFTRNPLTGPRNPTANTCPGTGRGRGVRAGHPAAAVLAGRQPSRPLRRALAAAQLLDGRGEMPRTLSSRSSTARCICCIPGRRNVPHWRRSASRRLVSDGSIDGETACPGHRRTDPASAAAVDRSRCDR